MDVLYDDKVDGLISKEQYENKMTQYEDQLSNIVEAKQKHNKANINYLKLGMNLFELAQKGRELYEKQANLSEKKELLNFVFSNLKINGDKVVPTPHNGFEVIALRTKNQNWLPSSDIIISALERIVKAFEDTIQVGLIKQRWEEIKMLNLNVQVAM